MDKKTGIGFFLIAVIVIGFTWLNKPSEEQQAKQKRYNDSIALVQKQQAELAKTDSAKYASEQKKDSAINNSDTTQSVVNGDQYGAFAVAATGAEKITTVETEFLELKISNKGGRIASVNLKKYKTSDSLPVILFDNNISSFNYVIPTNNNRVVNTETLYFEQVGGVEKVANGDQKVTMRLKTSNADAYVDFIYTIPQKSYMVGYTVQAHNMQTVMPYAANSLELQWKSKILQQEKGRKFEERYSELFYRYTSGDDEHLNAAKDDNKEISNKIQWIAFKNQFFSSILIADDYMGSAVLNSKTEPLATSKFIKEYSADINIPFDPSGSLSTGFKFYFGPNQYKILNSFDKGVDKDKKLKLTTLIPLGWGIFGWINKYAIIPMFNFFSRFLASYGLIILIMTFIIKMVLFPLTYKSYLSSAKMRVLKPEIDEINARIPADKAMDRQKATMELYNKVGVSPMSGCLPMLLQMPILFAMFSFFPSSFELRQQSFLWANDLSSYDSILSWHNSIPLIGTHLSLFTILMTITSIISTRLNTAATPQSSDQPGAGMMKWMMYLMPVMFFFMFNDYASGLSYYYFISSLITIIQTYAIRAFVDDEKLLAELHAKRNSKSPKKKSGFMERLEKMQREQQKAIQNQNKNKKR